MPDQFKYEDEGRELAKKHHWNGNEILAVCQAALTDANFHDEAEIVGQLLKALDDHYQPEYKLTVTETE